MRRSLHSSGTRRRWPLAALGGVPVLLVLSAACLAQAAGDGSAPPTQDREVAGFVDSWIERNLGELLQLYEHLHANPELSLGERETAARVAQELNSAGYEVTSDIGGHGVVGVLRNGKGPTLLIRGDMDALPIVEETGLPYASTLRTTDADGRSVGVMHACGHDVHTTNLVGTARLLARALDRWSGSLVILAQPAEELGRGARLMIADGLFDRLPRPDMTLALHVESDLPAGSVGLTVGWAFANVDAVDVTLHGRGAHGARPHLGVDPIVASAHFITALQTLVSRRLDPQEPAVVTVGSIHAGTRRNVIPDEARMQLTVRSYADPVRTQLLDGIRQLAADTCRTFECPRPAEISIRKEYTPAVYNDPVLASRARRLFEEMLGEDRVVARVPSMGGEDFGRYARALEVPGLLYRLGAVDPTVYQASRAAGSTPLPSLHSSKFAPSAAPTLETGIRTLTRLALELLAKR